LTSSYCGGYNTIYVPRKITIGYNAVAQMAVDPKRVFMTAEVYRAGSLVLGSLINRGMPHFILPMVTCSAFSLELHLKCLILLEGGTSTKDHDLEALFSKLTPESQAKIRASYEILKAKIDAGFAAAKGIPARPTDFDFVLRASAKAFVKFRYAYEGMVGNQEGWLANEIRDCVRERIVELQPTWANLKYGFDGPLLPPGI
jgi:hypothetical protein